MRNEVLTSLVEPCSYCGTPCTGTYRFWFHGKEADEAVVVDRYTLDSAVDDILGAQHGAEAYASLPAFVRGLNEGWWSTCAAPVAFDRDDFDRVLALLEQRAACNLMSDRQCALVVALRSLAQRAGAEGVSVRFLEG